MKYIDSEKLIAEIERRIVNGQDGYGGNLKALIPVITSLQQEQPDKYETALEKARKWMPNVNQGGHAILIDIFPELGESLDLRYGGRKQEQPDVDLEKEIKNYLATKCAGDDEPSVSEIARHFYELGLNTRKEETK